MTREAAKTLMDVEKELDQATPSVDKRELPKELLVVREDAGLYYINYSAGGEVPTPLKGKWTSVRVAEGAIADYKRLQEVAA